jgi:potassium/chloride transporter 9
MGLNTYVEVIRDILKMKKNLVISRNMNRIDKSELKSKTSPIYIDVWPINFLMPELCSQLDATSLFMLQLACILNMVSVWKRATLRVFLCTTVADAAENDRRKSRLDDLLAQLRINALTVLVPMETVRDVINRPIIKDEDLTYYQSSFTSQEILNVSDVYLRAVNQMIKSYSEQSALCFLYLPAPPKIQADGTGNPFASRMDSVEKAPAFITTTENDLDKSYIRMLETVSEGLPPTVYINGVNCVTSTQL